MADPEINHIVKVSKPDVDEEFNDLKKTLCSKKQCIVQKN